MLMLAVEHKLKGNWAIFPVHAAVSQAPAQRVIVLWGDATFMSCDLLSSNQLKFYGILAKFLTKIEYV